VKLSVVAGARPNLMKVAPLLRAFRNRAEVKFVHTGQHYDWQMSDAFLADLEMGAPDVNLGVGSGTHAQQTAAVLVAYEALLLGEPVDAVVVVGDVNSTLAAALAARKLMIPVAHVEAGLRSRDPSMPEEVNRRLTDCISRWLFAPTQEAADNLRAEGVDRESIHVVGNVMIDTLLYSLDSAGRRLPELQRQLRLPASFGLLTLHRPSNVDDPANLALLLDAIGELSTTLPIVFPVHPRTRERLSDAELHPNIVRIDPLPYLDFVALMTEASLVLTDSGGIQEETSVLGIPCLTLRENTERPETCTVGTNRVVGSDPSSIVAAAQHALAQTWRPGTFPMWDGRTAERIADVLLVESDTGSLGAISQGSVPSAAPLNPT
jgi:UDP-N-acetylglucosamine 2-epimerase (non-hydrolysing)